MKIAELLSDETKWCKGANAKNKDGLAVSIKSPTAVSWCLIGAVRYCYDPTERWNITRLLYKALRTKPIAAWNDDVRRTFKDVEALVLKLKI